MSSILIIWIPGPFGVSLKNILIISIGRLSWKWKMSIELKPMSWMRTGSRKQRLKQFIEKRL